jgi:hypothetical protein
MSDEEARRLPVTLDATTLKNFGSSTWMTDAGAVDVLREMPTTGGGYQTYDDLIGRHVIAEIGGVAVRIAALDDIVASKEHADRDKDREALPELHELQRSQHDDECASRR